jgi:hypothetical protein
MIPSFIKKKSAKDLITAPTHPTRSILFFLLCGLAVFAGIKMFPELRRYARIEFM